MAEPVTASQNAVHAITTPAETLAAILHEGEDQTNTQHQRFSSILAVTKVHS